MSSNRYFRCGPPTKLIRGQEQFLVSLCAPLPGAAVGIGVYEIAPGCCALPPL